MLKLAMQNENKASVALNLESTLDPFIRRETAGELHKTKACSPMM